VAGTVTIKGKVNFEDENEEEGQEDVEEKEEKEVKQDYRRVEAAGMREVKDLLGWGSMNRGGSQSSDTRHLISTHRNPALSDPYCHANKALQELGQKMERRIETTVCT